MQHILRLQSSKSSGVGVAVRYAIVGVIVGVVYVAMTTFLADIVGTPFPLALAAGYVSALSVHFTLQRSYVWAHHEQYALDVRAQLRRYVLLSLSQYSLTVTSTSLLPNALGTSVTLVYLATAPTLTLISFLVFRSKIFHGHR